MGTRGETIFSNRVLGPGEDGPLPGAIENARHARDDKKEKKHRVGGGSPEASPELKEEKPTYELVDSQEAERLVSRVFAYTKDVNTRQRLRNIKALKELTGVTKMKFKEEGLANLAQSMLEHGTIPKSFFLSGETAEAQTETIKPVESKGERNYEHIAAILNKPRDSDKDLGVLHNAKTDEDLFANNPELWMKVISNLRGRYHNRADDRSKKRYEFLTTGRIGNRFQSVLNERTKNQKPLESAPAAGKPETMQELRQAFMDARDSGQSELALAALAKAEVKYDRLIARAVSEMDKKRLELKKSEIIADRKAILRATKQKQPVEPKPIEPKLETTTTKAADAEAPLVSSAPTLEASSPEQTQDTSGLQAKFDEYQKEIIAIDDNFRASPKNRKDKKLINRRKELLALCIDIKDKLSPPKKLAPSKKSGNKVDTGKNKGGDHQLDDYEVQKLRDRMKFRREKKVKEKPSSPEQNKEMEHRRKAEQLIDKNLDAQLAGFNMTEDEKTAQRNTPFYKRKRQEAINGLLEKIKPRL